MRADAGLRDRLHELRHPDAEKHALELDQLRQRLAASQSPPSAEQIDET
jgi:hypothetical protein